MATVKIRRLADSCVVVDDGDHVALVDPGIYTWNDPRFSLDDIVWLDRILITHAHADHCHAEFVAALTSRFPDVEVQSTQQVVDLLGADGIPATTDSESWIRVVDAPHEDTPMGSGPPNVAFHVGGVFTHPGDSRRLDESRAILAVPMMPPWSSMTEAIAFANRLEPRFVIPIHDWNLGDAGLGFVSNVARAALAESITFVDLGHFESTELEV